MPLMLDAHAILSWMAGTLTELVIAAGTDGRWARRGSHQLPPGGHPGGQTGAQEQGQASGYGRRQAGAGGLGAQPFVALGHGAGGSRLAVRAGRSGQRSLRGGACIGPAYTSRGAQRLFYPPDRRDTNDHGLRCVVEISRPETAGSITTQRRRNIIGESRRHSCK